MTLLAADSLAQRAGTDIPGPDPYQRILDKIFPWVDKKGVSLVTIAMRFRPSFSPESEIVLRFNQDAATADHLTARKRIRELVSTTGISSLDLTALSTALGVEKRTHSISSRDAQGWLDNFWDALARSPESIRKNVGKIQLDGTKYELQVCAGPAIWFITIDDDELESEASGEAPIVRWMNSVRVAIDHSK